MKSKTNKRVVILAVLPYVLLLHTEKNSINPFSVIPLSSPPIIAGERTTPAPASSMAWNFASAVPFPPEIIAPACPILRPGGAVAPAIKPTTGLVMFSLIQAQASSSAEPPISPIIMTASVSGSSLNSFMAAV